MAEDLKEFARFDYVKMVEQSTFQDATITAMSEQQLAEELGISNSSLKYEDLYGSPATPVYAQS